MNYFRFLAGVFVSLILAACTAAHLDPVMTSATKNYFVQSVSVTSTDQFNAKIKTAANFNSAVQAG